MHLQFYKCIQNHTEKIQIFNITTSFVLTYSIFFSFKLYFRHTSVQKCTVLYRSVLHSLGNKKKTRSNKKPGNTGFLKHPTSNHHKYPRKQLDKTSPAWSLSDWWAVPLKSLMQTISRLPSRSGALQNSIRTFYFPTDSRITNGWKSAHNVSSLQQFFKFQIYKWSPAWEDWQTNGLRQVKVPQFKKTWNT